MRVLKTTLNGDPNVGLYGMATDRFAIISDQKADRDEISEALGVPVIVTRLARTDLTGIFIAANSNGVLLPDIIEKKELETITDGIKKISKDIKVKVIATTNTALGNLIICNDRAAVISTLLEDQKDLIAETLKVPVTVSDLMDLSIIGSICISTNRGFLMNMHAEKEDFELVEKNIKVEGDIGTVNFGGPFIRSGLIANSNGYLVGNQTTGPEISRIDEALRFIDV
ncbi:MAG: translation initiation factor IF-6 [Nanohaloarchaea archaeon]|nr:translation initiation factor IF-6 [Candidatus Nanohaloarchaea archaeon]